MPETPGPNVPFPPMEAELVSELPAADGWRYEPKWDGFRGVLENDGGELALWAREGRRRARALVADRPPAAPLLPRAAAARRADAVALRTRRRDRDRPRRRTRL